jgi:HK97 family phage portal protein
MATNPFRAVRDFLTGEDLKVRPPAALPEPAPEVKNALYAFTTENYDSTYVGPVLSAAMGGPRLDWNSAVYACIKAICDSFQEAPLRVFRIARDGSEEFENGHPLMALLDDPHPALSQPEVNWWLEYAKQVHGNAYLRKIRSSAGLVVELWPISPTKLWPVTTGEDAKAGVFISHYRMDLGDGKFEDVPVDDILHFRMGVDDRDHRLGLSPLRHLTREVSSDEEATKFSDALLKNYAVPGLAVTIPPGPSPTQEQVEQIRARLRAEYGGEGRGQIAVVANGATLQPIGFSPQQLDLKAAHEFPESRIAAVFGTPAMVVGLGIGLQRSTFSNYKEAREALFEQTIVPLWRADAQTFRKQLLVPDFAGTPDVRLKYDLNEVRALQEDQNQIYARLTEAVKAKWLKRNEARAEVGFDPIDGWDDEDEQSALDAAAGMLALQPPAEEEDEDEGDRPPPGGGGSRPPRPPAKAQGLGAIPGLLDVQRALMQPALEDALREFQGAQLARVRARLKRGA